MEMLIFLVMSSIEFCAMITLMFAIFRFSFSGYWIHTAFICVLLSYISFTMREMSFGEYAPVIQMIFFVLCIHLLYRVHWFYALIMGVVGYLSYLAIQMLVFTLLSLLQVVKWVNMDYYNTNGSMVAIGSIFISFISSIYLRKKGYGYTFVPTSEYIRLSFRGINLTILIYSLISIVVLCLAFLFLEDMIVFFLLSVVQILLLLFLLNYSMKKEWQD